MPGFISRELSISFSAGSRTCTFSDLSLYSQMHHVSFFLSCGFSHSWILRDVNGVRHFAHSVELLYPCAGYSCRTADGGSAIGTLTGTIFRSTSTRRLLVGVCSQTKEFYHPHPICKPSWHFTTRIDSVTPCLTRLARHHTQGLHQSERLLRTWSNLHETLTSNL